MPHGGPHLPDFLRNLAAPQALNPQPLATPPGPRGLAALLANPMLQQGLLGTGLALLAQSDQPGSLGGALGRALPVGLQQAQAAQQQQALDNILADAPEEMRDLVGLLRPEDAASFMLSQMASPEPDRATLSPGQVRFENGVPIASVPESEPEDTTLFRNYLKARETGFEGSLVEYQQAIREGTTININPDLGITDLPVQVQSQIRQIPTALDALDLYEQTAADFLDRGIIQRIAAQELGSGEAAGAAASLQALQQSILLQMKNLAELGVLAGPDVDIITNLIGDPTRLSALWQNPQTTLARISEAKRYLEGVSAGLERVYGPVAANQGIEPADPTDPASIRGALNR